jgi:hypothetical protein
MSRVVVLLVVATLCAGCAALERFRQPAEPPSEAARLTIRAETLAREGHAVAARDLYVRVVNELVQDVVHARALFNLARLQVDPGSGLQDYRAARLTFRRLLTEYPRGEREAEARAWDALLTQLASRETELASRDGELAARQTEVARLRNELAARDAEATRLRNEVAKAGADLQRLKRIDLNLERRR